MLLFHHAGATNNINNHQTNSLPAGSLTHRVAHVPLPALKKDISPWACGLEIISTASCATSATVVKSGKDSSNQSPRSTTEPHFAGEGSSSSHWQSLNMRTSTDYPIMWWGHTSFTNKNTYCNSIIAVEFGLRKSYPITIIPCVQFPWLFPASISTVPFPLPGTGCLESPFSTLAMCPNPTDSTTTSSASAVSSRQLPTSLSITSSVCTWDRAGAWCMCSPTAVRPSISLLWC